MHQTFGSILGQRLHAEHAPVLLARSLSQCEVSVTEVRSERPTFELTDSLPLEDSFIAALQLRDFPVQEYWEDGRPAPVTSLVAGHMNLFALQRDPRFRNVNPFHSIHFHLPRALFDRVADESGASRIVGLEYAPGVGIGDPVFRHLAISLAQAFAHPEEANQLFVDHVTLAVATHVATRYGRMRAQPRMSRGALSPWQKRRALELIDAHLNGKLEIAQLARYCELSSSYFSKAFRKSVGMTPHQWLLHRRVEKAKALLTQSVESIVQIALDCGFANQSHFTRVFTAAVGIPPAGWRRRARAGV